MAAHAGLGELTLAKACVNGGNQALDLCFRVYHVLAERGDDDLALLVLEQGVKTAGCLFGFAVELMRMLAQPMHAQPRRPHGRPLDVMELPDGIFRARFRFAKADLVEVAGLLGLPPTVVGVRRDKVDRATALCYLLARYAYPNRVTVELPMLFRRSSGHLRDIIQAVERLLLLHWEAKICFDRRGMELRAVQYSECIFRKSQNLMPYCVGFIDGTVRATCKPTIHQTQYYSGHKRHHAVKYQSVTTPDGLILSMFGAIPGRNDDRTMLLQSHLVDYLDAAPRHPHGPPFVVYGDSGYSRSLFVATGYNSVNTTDAQKRFNRTMSRIRETVEWGFGRISTYFAFCDFKKNQKVWLQPLRTQYLLMALLSNCLSCYYGNQTATYMECRPPTIEEYLKY